MPAEEWKKIPGVDIRYEASNTGRIRTVHPSLRCKTLATRKHQGYLSLRLTGRDWFVHRLVCLAFIPNPENKPQVNHKNGIKSDNRLENLEWVTPRENTLHARDVIKTLFPLGKHLFFGSANGSTKLTTEQAREIKGLFGTLSEAQIAAKFNISRGAIQSIKRGESWRAA